MTLPQLHDALAAAVSGASWARRLMRAPVIWFTVAAVQVDQRRWQAVCQGEHGYGYNRRQARQMLRHVQALMERDGGRLEDLLARNTELFGP